MTLSVADIMWNQWWTNDLMNMGTGGMMLTWYGNSLQKNLSKCHFARHKTHMLKPGTALVRPQFNTNSHLPDT